MASLPFTMYAGKIVHTRCAHEMDSELHANQREACDIADRSGYYGDLGVRGVVRERPAADPMFDEDEVEGWPEILTDEEVA
jgi:hypothetical protein